MNREKNLQCRAVAQALALEPRLLFDGAGALAVADHPGGQADSGAGLVFSGGLSDRSHEAGREPVAMHQGEAGAGQGRAEALLSGAPDLLPVGGSTLLVIDTRVSHYQDLMARIPAGSGVVVRVVEREESGLAAITEALAQSQGYAAIHILSHGTPGHLSLGTDVLDSRALDEQAEALQGWGQHLTAEADILLYGCSVGRGASGLHFIHQLARLTGADVAASSNATGAASRGGDGVLEMATGSIDAPVLALAGYDGLLAATAITDSQAMTTRTTNEDTPLAVHGVTVTADVGSDVLTLRIQATDGVAALGTVTGLAFVSGSNASADFSVSGTCDDLNAALASLEYTPQAGKNSVTAGFAPSLALDVTAGGAGSCTISNISVTALNDAPVVNLPAGPINIDSANPLYNKITGVTVADGDVANGGTDFLQVTARLLDVSGTPVTNYSTGLGGGGVQITYATPADISDLWRVSADGNNRILQLQGRLNQVNAALAGLAVTFDQDLNAVYKLEVIADDRLRDATGALVTGGDDANGGEKNQPLVTGDSPVVVDGTAHDWSTAVPVPAGSGNLTRQTVDLRASRVNELATFTALSAITVTEDVFNQVGGGTGADKYTLLDPESTGMGTPVTVVASVPGGHGTLHIRAGTPVTLTSVTPTGGQVVTLAGNASNALTLTGRIEDVQAVLNARNATDTVDDSNTGLFFKSAANGNHDYNGGAAGDVTLTLTFKDGGSAIGGDVGSGSVINPNIVRTAALTIDAINDAPLVNRASTAKITIAGSSPVAITGFTVTDVDSSSGYATGESNGNLQAWVRLLKNNGTPFTAAEYATYQISIGSSDVSGSVQIDAAETGNQAALKIRGTLAQINTYVTGLNLTIADPSAGSLDSDCKMEVLLDDRLRDKTTGALTIPSAPQANGGTLNQNGTATPTAISSKNDFDTYLTKLVDYKDAGVKVYNVVSNTRDLFVSPVNNPAKVTASDATFTEGAALTLNATYGKFWVVDPDDNGATSMEVTVTVSQGVISVASSGGTVTGNGTSAITLTGATEAQINNRIRAITVTMPDLDGAGPLTSADWNGKFDATLVYNDKGRTGARPSPADWATFGDTDNPRSTNGDYDYVDGSSNQLKTTRTITVTVTPGNDAPLRTQASVSLAAIDEDTHGAGASVVSLFSPAFSDARDDVRSLTGDLSSSVANSFLGVALTEYVVNAAQGKWQVSTNGGTTWADLPSNISLSNTYLLDSSPNTLLRYDPAPNFHGTPNVLKARLVDSSSGVLVNGTRLNLSPGTATGGATRYSNFANEVTLASSVTNVNDRPTATGGTLTAAEDIVTGSGTLVGSLSLGYADATDDRSAISGGGNAATTLGGIAVVGDTTAVGKGTWQYSEDGVSWLNVPSGVSPTQALVLPTT
ncbi:MAG: DUF4347 domain-containing protein, partial [Sterolibacterium sp.]|nr:DUF4347 domain-containing protein [Sterolibacterium sp.]